MEGIQLEAARGAASGSNVAVYALGWWSGRISGPAALGGWGFRRVSSSGCEPLARTSAEKVAGLHGARMGALCAPRVGEGFMRGLRACWRACSGFGGISAMRNFSWRAALWAAALRPCRAICSHAIGVLPCGAALCSLKPCEDCSLEASGGRGASAAGVVIYQGLTACMRATIPRSQPCCRVKHWPLT